MAIKKAFKQDFKDYTLYGVESISNIVYREYNNGIIITCVRDQLKPNKYIGHDVNIEQCFNTWKEAYNEALKELV